MVSKNKRVMENYLEHKGYYGSVEFSAEDNVLCGQIIGISDLVNYEATAVDELANTFIEAVDDYLETCEEIGKSPDKFCKGVFNVRTTKEDMAKCMLSILDYLKLQDNCNDKDDMLKLNNETLSEMMFRKMKFYHIDLNKELGFTHLKPVIKK